MRRGAPILGLVLPALMLTGCGNTPPPPPAPLPASAPPIAVSAPAPSISASATTTVAAPTGPDWLLLNAPPKSFAVDGKVAEWQSLGPAKKGWFALQQDRLVVAGVAPAGAASIEVRINLGDRYFQPPNPRVMSHRLEPEFDCKQFSGAAAKSCSAALKSQEEAISVLWEAAAPTYAIQGTTVTIQNKPAQATKGALSATESGSWFELEIPFAELPMLSQSRVAKAGIRVRAAGDTKSEKVDELKWTDDIAVGGDKGILADAILAIIDEGMLEHLFTVLDPSGPEPLLRTLRLPKPTGTPPDQRAKALSAPIGPMKVETKTGDLEILRYEVLGIPAVATRKAGQIVDAFAVRGGAYGSFTRFVVRGDRVDIGYDDVEPVGDDFFKNAVEVFFGVARVASSGIIDRKFGGANHVVGEGNTRIFAPDLSRFELRGRFYIDRRVPPAQGRLYFTYNPKSGDYE